ncbi:MAG: DUF2079 domain-containing protein [Candidatus Rokubacteria bacterium]|nr:DUF2079 domain-containing protein [Candidatus Rokubacteria bacterium]
MSGTARLLDALAVGLGALVLAILLTGGFTVAGARLTRPEDVVVALAILAGIRAFLVPYRLPDVRPQHAVIGGVVAYVVLMAFVMVTRHQALRTHALDLGYYVQLVWNMSRGYGAYVTLPPMHAWGDHFSPVFYLFAPIAWIAPGAAALLIAQTLILAVGAFAVYQFGWLRLKDDGHAAAFALLYLLNPSMHGVNIRDIHPQAFAIALVPAAALAFDRRRYLLCALALALTLAGREDAAVVGVGFGVWMAVARARWLAGAGVAVASVAVLLIDVTFVMPYFRGAPYPHLGRYAWLGASLGQILGALVLEPWVWLPVAFAPAKLLYLVAMLAPLGFLPLLAPRALAAVGPPLAMNLLSVDSVLFHHRTQYQSFVLPFLILAAVEGCRRLSAPVSRTRSPVSATTVIAFGFVVSVVLASRTVNDLAVTRWLLAPEHRAAYRLMEQIPGGVPVSVNERFVPHLATRREIHIFPAGLPASEFILDLSTVGSNVPPTYRKVISEGPWTLWRRS